MKPTFYFAGKPKNLTQKAMQLFDFKRRKIGSTGHAA